MSDFEIVKSEYNALDETGNYKTHYFKTSADQVVGLSTVGSTGSYNDLKDKPVVVQSVNGQTGDVIIDALPVGTIISYAGNATPSGFLDCSGAELNPNTYARLFGVIGTTYGGNGSTTFNLPNLNNNSFLEGSDTVGTVKSAGLPNITGAIGTMNDWKEQCEGAFYRAENRSSATFYDVSTFPLVRFDASRSSAIYGNSNTVQPKSVTVKFCIKY